MKKLLLLLLLVPTIANAQLPQKISIDNQVIKHDGYILSYNETCEQANWVFYKMTIADLEGKKVSRRNIFKEDTLIPTGSASPADYKGTGYDRGHLKPAGDEPTDRKEMDETFYMSNISPQHPSLNRGMWKRVENYVRLVVRASDSVYIVAGGILHSDLNTLENTDVCIPEFYFKVIYRFTNGKMGVTCFLMANKKLGGDLTDYKVPLSAIENLSNIKFSIKID